jgi:tetratricopeptide (TPR) repeat protein
MFNMPSAFGGSKKRALEYYLKAWELIEKNPESLSGDWNYMNLLITIGQTYASLEDYSSARKIYQNILELEPGFIYVKDDLYPKLLMNMEK